MRSSRTLWRIAGHRRKLLEWETAAAAEQRLGSELKDFARGMWSASALAAGDCRCGRRSPAGRALGGLSLSGRLAPLAALGVLGQPPQDPARIRAERGRANGPAADRAEDLAILRDVRRRC